MSALPERPAHDAETTTGGAPGPGGTAPGPGDPRGASRSADDPRGASRSAICIVVDAMGGDHAPDEVVRAAAALSLEAAERADAAGRRDLHLTLVGDAPRLSALLHELRHNPERIALHHASQAIAMDESPQEALQKKPDASIAVAARLCAEGQGHALVSAGNTGAAVLACRQHFRRLPGVRKCALAAVYPTEIRRGEKDDPFSLILDVGATLDVTADDLCSFAVMGAAYASRISRNPRPRVALLSNGSEAGKGPAAVVEAHARLRCATDLNFVGNVEGVDIPRGTADVVVCGGFVGNVVLKMLEGVSETVVRLAGYAYKERLLWRAGLWMLSGGIRRLKELSDWEQYGGAPLLGFDQLFIKAHGRSRSRALRNAIKVAARATASGLLENIQSSLQALPQAEAAEAGKAAGEGSR